jgi:putative transposase
MTAIHRTDLLPAAMNVGKEAAVPGVAGAKAEIGAQRIQMVRYQVVGTLTSFVSNRQNDFAEIVGRHEAFDDRTKHMLRVVNKAQAWFVRGR